jgi:hypothetical protein
MPCAVTEVSVFCATDVNMAGSSDETGIVVVSEAFTRVVERGSVLGVREGNLPGASDATRIVVVSGTFTCVVGNARMPCRVAVGGRVDEVVGLVTSIREVARDNSERAKRARTVLTSTRSRQLAIRKSLRGSFPAEGCRPKLPRGTPDASWSVRAC